MFLIKCYRHTKSNEDVPFSHEAM